MGQASSSCWKATLESRNWGRSADWKGEWLEANKLDGRLGKVVVGYSRYIDKWLGHMNRMVDLDRLRNGDVLGNVDGLDDMVNMDGGRSNSCCCCCCWSRCCCCS